MHPLTTHYAPKSDEVAVLRLAKDNDTSALLALSAKIDPNRLQKVGQLLAENGDVEAIKTLNDAGLLSAYKMLEQATDDKDLAATRTLINTGIGANSLRATGQLAKLQDTSVGQEALLNLLDDTQLADDVKTERLKFLLTARVNSDKVLEKLALVDNKTKQLTSLIELGAPTVGLLMDLAKRRFGSAQQRLILAGADFANALDTLYANNQIEIVSELGINLAKARDRDRDLTTRLPKFSIAEHSAVDSDINMNGTLTTMSLLRAIVD